MKAFVNTPITKERFLKHLKWHQKQDAFVSGTYGEGGGDYFRGCAVGCSIHSIQMELKDADLEYDNHKLYEDFLNVPEWLAKLEDAIFEGLPKEKQRTWPVDFAEAIPIGAKLDKIEHPFFIYLMEENLKSLDSCKYDENSNPDNKKVIEQTKDAIRLAIKYHKNPSDSAARSATRSAAELAAESVIRSVAESVIRSAAWSAARSVAESTESAWSAARSVAESTESARSVAWSAESEAGSVWSAGWSAVRSAAFERYANKLLELMKKEGEE